MTFEINSVLLSDFYMKTQFKIQFKIDYTTSDRLTHNLVLLLVVWDKNALSRTKNLQMMK